MQSAPRLHLLLITLLSAGWIWILINLGHIKINSIDHNFCLFKNVTSVPCPSCGSTRSIESIMNGDLLQGIYINPLGLLILLFMLTLPIWILYDIVTGNDRIFKVYKRTEMLLKTKWSILFITPLLLNWIWNIYKGI